MGYTKNTIVINKDFDTVFDITNRINDWKDLFTEYKESIVLSQEENTLKFRLTTHPDKDGHFHSWISKRIIDKENKICTAERLEPKYPFEEMNIRWEYREVTNGTEMTWIQKFKVAEKCPWNEKQFEDYLNKNTKVQMASIREKIENGLFK